MAVALSSFARSLTNESAFSVLAVAKALKAQGKDVVELEIGDSPFETPASAKASGISAIQTNQTHYCPSPGLPEFRKAAADSCDPSSVSQPDPRIFPSDRARRSSNSSSAKRSSSPATVCWSSARSSRPMPRTSIAAGLAWSPATCGRNTSSAPRSRPSRSSWTTEKQPKAIFLNSPHNPTGGVTTEQDLRDIADLVRGKNIAVFSDEPYCHMVWQGRHHSILAQPGMLDQCVAAYTFSKSYSMSGWRLGFAVASAEVTEAIGKMINTSVSCTPPLVQLAGLKALTQERAERDRQMGLFRDKVQLLNEGLARIDGFKTLPPAATFYVFPNVSAVCERLGIISHGLAMYLLEGADDHFGVACLGGECFGAAGAGFLRFSCAEPNERLQQAIDFIPVALGRSERLAEYLAKHPQYRLA